MPNAEAFGLAMPPIEPAASWIRQASALYFLQQLGEQMVQEQCGRSFAPPFWVETSAKSLPLFWLENRVKPRNWLPASRTAQCICKGRLREIQLMFTELCSMSAGWPAPHRDPPRGSAPGLGQEENWTHCPPYQSQFATFTVQHNPTKGHRTD